MNEGFLLWITHITEYVPLNWYNVDKLKSNNNSYELISNFFLQEDNALLIRGKGKLQFIEM